jgi:hypothetical protein
VVLVLCARYQRVCRCVGALQECLCVWCGPYMLSGAMIVACYSCSSDAAAWVLSWVLLMPCVFRGYGTVQVCLPRAVQLWVVLLVRHCQLF